MKFKVDLRIEDEATGHIHYDGPSHSFVQGFGLLLATQNKYATLGTTTKDIGGTARQVVPYQTNLWVNSEPGYGTKGICCGIGNQAEDVTDYKMGTICGHGTALGQLYYHNMSWSEPVVFAGSANLTMSRRVTNRGTVAQDIYEIGIIGVGVVTTTQYPILVLRDVLVAPLNIGVDETKMIQYTFGVVP